MLNLLFPLVNKKPVRVPVSPFFLSLSSGWKDLAYCKRLEEEVVGRGGGCDNKIHKEYVLKRDRKTERNGTPPLAKKPVPSRWRGATWSRRRRWRIREMHVAKLLALGEWSRRRCKSTDGREKEVWAQERRKRIDTRHSNGPPFSLTAKRNPRARWPVAVREDWRAVCWRLAPVRRLDCAVSERSYQFSCMHARPPCSILSLLAIAYFFYFLSFFFGSGRCL